MTGSVINTLMDLRRQGRHRIDMVILSRRLIPRHRARLCRRLIPRHRARLCGISLDLWEIHDVSTELQHSLLQLATQLEMTILA